MQEIHLIRTLPARFKRFFFAIAFGRSTAEAERCRKKKCCGAQRSIFPMSHKLSDEVRKSSDEKPTNVGRQSENRQRKRVETTRQTRLRPRAGGWAERIGRRALGHWEHWKAGIGSDSDLCRPSFATFVPLPAFLCAGIKIFSPLGRTLFLSISIFFVIYFRGENHRNTLRWCSPHNNPPNRFTSVNDVYGCKRRRRLQQ